MGDPNTTLHWCEVEGCTLSFASVKKRREHVRIDHPECPLCGAKELDQRELLSHIKHQHFRCNLCDQSLRTAVDLEQHKKERRQCNACSSAFCTKALLQRHQRDYHIKCHCGVWVADMEEHTWHKKYNHPICDSCNRYFETRVLFDEHCKYCDLCPGKFCDQSLLDDHRKATHTECSYCGKFFLNAAAYKTHKIYEHKCARCPACFTTQEAYYEHWNAALPCQLCPTDRTETWYCTQTALREHQQKAHVKCSVCSELFRDRK